jgi:glyoxylase-like metal-dependent hydrolase (beta-lactamase superfamily II)/predicted amino acid-binding ACT domain protein
LKKTYVTTMPDHVGAFLKASRCFAALNVNITRVSYNKAVDIHTLFIEVEGDPAQLEQADAQLAEIGYLQSAVPSKNTILLEFKLQDIPGGVTAILELIEQFNFNISYLSSQENGSDHQLFKMGLFIENMDSVSTFLDRARDLCPVRVLDYSCTEKTFDNSVFYRTLATELGRYAGLSPQVQDELIIDVNLAMQTLDERGLSPYKTFDSIGRFAELLARHRGTAFAPRVSTYSLGRETELTLIEPPCGSNTAILKNSAGYLFIDSGYACYRQEMLRLFHQLIPDFDTVEKRLLLTHADVDHGGLMPLFQTVYVSQKSFDSLILESAGLDGFRERNPLHRPYIRICKKLTAYPVPRPDSLQVICGDAEPLTRPLEPVGTFAFGELKFQLYEGGGGHLPGELILLDQDHKLAFTGDVFVNLKGMIPQQAEYNRYAPILMTSVDTNPTLCASERALLFQLLSPGDWLLFGGHGAPATHTALPIS